MFLLGFILYGTLCTSWTWVTVSFPMLGKFSVIISSNIFSGPFSLSYPSVAPIMQMLVCLMLSHRSLDCPAFFFILFSLFCSVAVISTTLSSSSLICSSACYSAIPSSVFFISVIVLSNCLFLKSSCSLLNISCSFLVCASILFLRPWIIFTSLL